MTEQAMRPAVGASKFESVQQAFAKLANSKPEEPACKRLVVNDATVEKVHEIQKSSPSVLVLRDELVGFMTSMDRAGHEADRAFWLECWNGNGSFIVDRIGRGTTIANSLTVSIVGGIQPDRLQWYLADALDGGNDGLIQRFQLMVQPDSPIGEPVDAAPDSVAEQRALTLFNALDSLPVDQMSTLGAVAGDRLAYFNFAEDAQHLVTAWFRELTHRLQREEENSILLEHLSKMRKTMPSLALIFHAVDVMGSKTNPGAISAGATQMAIDWCSYLESHARRIYGATGNASMTAAQALAEKILAREVSDRFTQREVYRHQWSALNSPELVKAACNELVEARWLREEKIRAGSVGGRPSIEYRINPKIFLAHATKRTDRTDRTSRAS